MQKLASIDIKIMDPRTFLYNKLVDPKNRNYIGFPWTYKQTIRSVQACTEPINACTAGGIFVLNKNKLLDVVAFHIAPFDSENADFRLIEETIIDKIGSDEPVSGFLIGSQKIYKQSIEIFDKFKQFLGNKIKIPFSSFEGLLSDRGFAGFICNARRHQLIITDAQSKGLEAFDKVNISTDHRLIS